MAEIPQTPQSRSSFSDMPGVGKGAVVLPWIAFGFGICGGVAMIAGLAVLSALDESIMANVRSEVPWLMPLMVFSIIQVVIWTVLRGVFAVRIPRRNASARSGAVILEAVGIAISVVSWIAMFSVDVTGFEYDASNQFGSILGLAMSAVIIGLLSSAEMREYCDQ